jgi:hypothetical protein
MSVRRIVVVGIVQSIAAYAFWIIIQHQQKVSVTMTASITTKQFSPFVSMDDQLYASKTASFLTLSSSASSLHLRRQLQIDEDDDDNVKNDDDDNGDDDDNIYRFVQDDDTGTTGNDDYVTDDIYLDIAKPKVIHCQKVNNNNNSNSNPMTTRAKTTTLRIGYLGNSIIFYNDCPHIVQQMLLESKISNEQNTCVQGGATFLELFDNGCGVKSSSFFPSSYTYQNTDDNQCYEQKVDHVKTFLNQFSNDTNRSRNDKNHSHHGYDYVVLNDQSQYPARIITRADSMWSLKKQYGPVWPEEGAIPLLLQTPAYRVAGKGITFDLGDYDTFTQSLKDGYQQYQDVFNNKILTTSNNNSKRKALIVPVGDAYQIIRNTNMELWERLYDHDDYHPSVYGTYLQACIIYRIVTQGKQDVPSFQKRWWENARHVIAAPQFPTSQEAKELVKVAIMVTSHDNNNNEKQVKNNQKVADANQTIGKQTKSNMDGPNNKTNPKGSMTNNKNQFKLQEAKKIVKKIPDNRNNQR